jgi:hypothetical protein
MLFHVGAARFRVNVFFQRRLSAEAKPTLRLDGRLR